MGLKIPHFSTSLYLQTEKYWVLQPPGPKKMSNIVSTAVSIAVLARSIPVHFHFGYNKCSLTLKFSEILLNIITKSN